MEKRIKQCLIRKEGFKNYITALYNDDTTDAIGSYYPDELHFTENEFVGLTSQQAINLITQKDIAYLRR